MSESRKGKASSFQVFVDEHSPE
jgi:hypothetical protein